MENNNNHSQKGLLWSWSYGSWIYNYSVSVQSVSITTKVISLNLSHGKVYSIQHYVIRFISDLWQSCGFLWIFQFPPPIKLTPRYNWNIVESGVKHLMSVHNIIPNLEDTKEVIKSCKSKDRQCNGKRKKGHENYKTLQGKLKIEKQEPH